MPVSLAFLSHPGEMGALLRSRDWSRTPIGVPAAWPVALQTLVGLMIGSPQPMLVVWGPERTSLYNDAYAAMLGQRHPAALGQALETVWYEIWDQIEPILSRAYAGEPTYMNDIEFVMLRNGFPEETHFDFSYTPVRGDDSRVAGMFCVCTETTERVRSERTLRENEATIRGREAQFRILAQAVPNQVWTATEDGSLDWFNNRVFAYCGLGYDDLVGNRWAQIVHPDDLASASEAWARSLKDRTLYETEFRIRKADGSYRWNLVRAEPVTDDNGAFRWIGTNTDIHDQKVAFGELAAVNESLETEVLTRTRERDRLWQNSQDLSVIIDPEGRFRAVNPAVTTILGWTPEEMLGRTVFDFVLPEDLVATGGALQHAAHDTLPTYENRYRHKDGGYRVISWVAAPEDDLIYATGRHVTAEREAAAQLAAVQDQLRQAQKMEAVGQLTGGIAHDFNNMLAVVVGSLDLLTRRIETGDARSRRYVDNAMEGARRAATLTQRLLAFSRQQPLSPEAVEANKLVANMSDLLRQTLSGEIRFETVLGGGLWRCLADPNQLENAILNLAVNARDAMPDGGRLTIETQNSHLDDRYATTNLGVTPGQYVLIAVTDTGSGMPREVIEKAFDPFFTTKEIGKGTGLGLSQVYGFVKQSDGHVKIYSEPGQGTTVKIYLPRHLVDTVQHAPNDTDVPEASDQEALELVLVVEDDDSVRRVTLDALQELGYRTLESEDAGEALRLLDLHPGIELLFTDIVMPDVNGRKLADEALRRRPDLKVLFTTGYTRNAVVHNGVLDAGVQLLGKPFTLDELSAKVREILDKV